MLLVWLGMWREDGGAFDVPELAVLQHGQLRPTGHVLPAAAPSWWPMDEDSTGKEEAPLFRLCCKQNWQGTLHITVQVYICDTHDI